MDRIDGRHAYLVGIGGCGMSGLARVLRARGGVVSGSDSVASDVTRALAREGIEVGLEQTGDALPDDADMVIASAAIKPGHPQLLEAERRGLTVMTYAEALGASMGRHTGVALAGTHGKSTTTAMLGAALVDAGLDPSVIVGAQCAQLANGALRVPGTPIGYRVGADRIAKGRLAGRPGLMLAEACEFNRSFHDLRPTVASISCVEADHLDVYGSLDAVVEAFRGFAQLVPPAEEGGVLLIGYSGGHRREITAGLRCEVQTIGFNPGADWQVTYDPRSGHVRLEHERCGSIEWTMRLPGAHNAMNAATAGALAIILGADARVVGESLGAFSGLERRTQCLGERRVPGGAVRVYDDYGHHPTEIDATLTALREFERPHEHGGRLICVFQPHQHSRTRFLLEEFASAFSTADVVIVPHIYFVRDSEAERHKVSAADLVDRLRARGVQAMHLYPFEAIVEQLENVCRGGDLLVVMGAGPVWQVAHSYLKAPVREALDVKAAG